MNAPNEILHNLIQEDESIMLVNTYKGIPVSFPAIFVGEQQDEYKVKTHPFQSLCIDINKLTIIQSERIETPLMAFAENVDPADSIVTLNNICFANPNAGKRKYDRVVPMGRVDISVISSNLELPMIRGILIDISEGGLGFQTRESVEFENGEKASFSFSLSIQDEEINFPGIQGIIRYNFIEDGRRSTRIGIELLPDENELFNLKAYTLYRRKMINEELQLLMPVAL